MRVDAAVDTCAQLWARTLAFCKGPYSSLLQAYFGAHDLCEKDWASSQAVGPKNILVHPGYNPTTFSNDLAILRLAQELHLGGKVRTVSLPPEVALMGCPLPQYDKDQLQQEREQCTSGPRGFFW